MYELVIFLYILIRLCCQMSVNDFYLFVGYIIISLILLLAYYN